MKDRLSDDTVRALTVDEETINMPTPEAIIEATGYGS